MCSSDLDRGPVHSFTNPALNSDVKVQFSESVGVNDVRIEVVTPATGLSGLAVDFLPPDTSSVNGMTIDPVPLSGAGIAVLEKVDGFTLGASGTWTVVVRVGDTVMDGSVRRRLGKVRAKMLGGV